MSDEFGWCEGDTCNREGCKGVIQMRKADGCSCHISPPCSACTSPRQHCDTCDWDEADEEIPAPEPMSQKEQDYWKSQREEWERIRNAPLDNTKVSWRDLPHTHFTMIKEGVYPEHMTRAEVAKEVAGTFGGRFEYFGGGKFKYIAYTD